MIIIHDQFHKFSTSSQAPILLQFMVALFCFDRMRIMICMPYLTIFGLFVEIWTVCSPEEAHGNEKS